MKPVRKFILIEAAIVDRLEELQGKLAAEFCSKKEAADILEEILNSIAEDDMDIQALFVPRAYEEGGANGTD